MIVNDKKKLDLGIKKFVSMDQKNWFFKTNFVLGSLNRVWIKNIIGPRPNLEVYTLYQIFKPQVNTMLVDAQSSTQGAKEEIPQVYMHYASS
jgi:hypothetical protein